MVVQHIRYAQVLLISAALICFIGCAGKKSSRDEALAGIPSETVSEGQVPEEPIQESLIGEEGLDALRALEVAAQREGALEDIYFDFNQYTLTAEAQAKLQKTAAWLEQHPTVTVLVEGHCDERGSQEYNLALGQRRAVSVESYLSSLGTDAARMETISYGEERPANTGNTEEAWAQNRRVHFTVAHR